MAIDVTDQTFSEQVIAASEQHPVIVDLWAPWCGPCRTLGPILERVVEESDGALELVKVNVDENPEISAAFQVQSIPAVYAMSGGKVVDGFVGALPEDKVREFLNKLMPDKAPSEIDLLLEAGDENALRTALSQAPDEPRVVASLAELLIEQAKFDEALGLLAKVPETAQTRHLGARARLGAAGGQELGEDQLELRLNALLDRVKGDDEARQEFIDLLESMDLEDPRRASFRKALSSRLF